MMRRLILLILIPYSIALIGCGQSGALYYPKSALSAPILEESPPIQKGDSPLKQSQPPEQTQKPNDRQKPKQEKGTP